MEHSNELILLRRVFLLCCIYTRNIKTNSLCKVPIKIYRLQILTDIILCIHT